MNKIPRNELGVLSGVSPAPGRERTQLRETVEASNDSDADRKVLPLNLPRSQRRMEVPDRVAVDVNTDGSFTAGVRRRDDRNAVEHEVETRFQAISEPGLSIMAMPSS